MIIKNRISSQGERGKTPTQQPKMLETPWDFNKAEEVQIEYNWLQYEFFGKNKDYIETERQTILDSEQKRIQQRKIEQDEKQGISQPAPKITMSSEVYRLYPPRMVDHKRKIIENANTLSQIQSSSFPLLFSFS